MSRTYRNAIRRGYKKHPNTLYYHQRRKMLRAMLRNTLALAMSYEEPDEVFIHPEDRICYVDRWSQPDEWVLIDKSYATPKSIEIDLKKDYWTEEWQNHCIRKWYSKLKPKHAA